MPFYTLNTHILSIFLLSFHKAILHFSSNILQKSSLLYLMKQRSIVHFLFFFVLIVCQFNCFKDTSLLNDKQIVDAVHVPHINPLFKEADAAKYAQDYKKADRVFRDLLIQKLTAVDSQYVLNQLAYINLTMNEDTIGYQWIQSLEKLNTPLSISAQTDYNYNIGTWAYHTFKPKMAELYLKKALFGYEKIYGVNHLRTAMCMTQLGHLFYEFSDYPDSIFSYIPRAYDVFQTNSHLKAFSGYNELGMVYVNFTKRNNEMGHYHAENAIHLLTNTTFIDSITLARATSFNGQMIKKIGDLTKDTIIKNKLYDKAETNFKNALSIINENHPRYQEILRNALFINISKNDSLHFFSNLSKLRNKVEIQGNFYAFEERLLGVYNDICTHKSNEVIRYYTQFLTKYAQDSLVGHVLKTEAYYCLITAYSDTSSLMYNHNEALRYANAWITGNHSAHSMNLPANEIDLLSSKSYKAMYSFVPLELIAQSYWAKYLRYKKLSDLKKTIEVYKKTDSLLFRTIDVLENNVIIDFQNDIGNLLYPNAIKAIYEYYDKTKDKNSFDDAFRFIERLKSGILFKDIELLNKNDNTAILRSEFDNLIGTSVIYKLNDYKTSDRITYLNRRLEKLMQIKISQSNILKQSIAKIKQQLKPEQAIIQFSLDEDQSVLHAIYLSTDTTFFYQYISKDIKNKLIYYQKCLKDYSNIEKDKSAFIETSYYLYQKLIKPFEADLHKRNDLVIIPDRNLHQIPFESLMETNNFIDYKSAPYLIKRSNFTISYAPSWKIFQFNSSKSDVFSSDRLLYFTYGKNTVEIPCAGEETDSIKIIFGQQADIYTNRECTKKQFLQSWTKNYGILHIALHAQGKTDSLFNNKIWFQPNKQDALYGFELTGTQTPIKLVVLSACETNVGNSDLGEGVYSMARYFFQSNTKVVVASLWQIEDCPNAQIMRIFYHLLRGGQKPKQALCEAKRLFLKQSSDNLLAHPSYWAGMVCLD
jgi:CHAT domain-containing protein